MAPPGRQRQSSERGSKRMWTGCAPSWLRFCTSACTWTIWFLHACSRGVHWCMSLSRSMCWHRRPCAVAPQAQVVQHRPFYSFESTTSAHTCMKYLMTHKVYPPKVLAVVLSSKADGHVRVQLEVMPRDDGALLTIAPCSVVCDPGCCAIEPPKEQGPALGHSAASNLPLGSFECLPLPRLHDSTLHPPSVLWYIWSSGLILCTNSVF